MKPIVKELTVNLLKTFVFSYIISLLATLLYALSRPFIEDLLLVILIAVFAATIFSSTIYLNLYKTIRNSLWLSFLSFFLLPLCVAIRMTFLFGLHYWDTILIIIVPFFLLHFYYFLVFHKKTSGISIHIKSRTIFILIIVLLLLTTYFASFLYVKYQSDYCCGYILDEEGNPVDRVDVYFMDNPIQYTKTNEDGFFRIHYYNAPHDYYYLELSKEGYYSKRISVSEYTGPKDWGTKQGGWPDKKDIKIIVLDKEKKEEVPDFNIPATIFKEGPFVLHDTTFLKRGFDDMFGYQAIFIDTNKKSEYYDWITDFNFDEETLDFYTTGLRKKFPKGMPKFDLDSLPRKWVQLFRYQEEYFLYIPSEGGYQNPRLITDSVMIFKYLDGPFPYVIKSLKKEPNKYIFRNQDIFGHLDVFAKPEKLTIHIVDQESKMAVWEYTNDDGSQHRYYLYVPVEYAHHYNIIVNYCELGKTQEFDKFEEIDFKGLLK